MPELTGEMLFLFYHSSSKIREIRQATPREGRIGQLDPAWDRLREHDLYSCRNSVSLPTLKNIYI
jgi:hypothetical protein